MIAAHTRWTIAARPEELAGLRATVSDLAAQFGAPAALQNDIALATTEAATNAIMHAYGRRDPGTISVVVGLAGDRMLVLVADDGTGFEVRSDSPGLGLGLPLIEALTHRLEVNERYPSGSELVMHFDLAGG